MEITQVAAHKPRKEHSDAWDHYWNDSDANTDNARPATADATKRRPPSRGRPATAGTKPSFATEVLAAQ